MNENGNQIMNRRKGLKKFHDLQEEEGKKKRRKRKKKEREVERESR